MARRIQRSCILFASFWTTSSHIATSNGMVRSEFSSATVGSVGGVILERERRQGKQHKDDWPAGDALDPAEITELARASARKGRVFVRYAASLAVVKDNTSQLDDKSLAITKASIGSHISFASPPSETALWPPYFVNAMCTRSDFVTEQNQMACQGRAIDRGHLYYQYNEIDKSCATTDFCSPENATSAWQIFRKPGATDVVAALPKSRVVSSHIAQLWPPFGTSHRICTSSAPVLVSDQSMCQKLAIHLDHAYYQYVESKKECATVETCDSPVNDTKGWAWQIYRQPLRPGVVERSGSGDTPESSAPPADAPASDAPASPDSPDPASSANKKTSRTVVVNDQAPSTDDAPVRASRNSSYKTFPILIHSFVLVFIMCLQ